MAVVRNSHQALLAGKQMLDSVENVKGLLKAIEEHVDAAKPGFQGRAATAFYGVADQFHTNAETMRQKLDAIGEQVRSGSQQYGNMDDIAETEVQQSGGGLLNI
ncbi:MULTISPECIES: WXG100 family type VII secretion target [unclassified Nocardia]|uniref:WXG100 family type VII secretion target n=1 Tax=unclassified Nocardia TaxID=2637762 RepID=UPI001CE4573A|nr:MULTISPECIES: WXG100 family type VII secretion target [unclassified Nocardia]